MSQHKNIVRNSTQHARVVQTATTHTRIKKKRARDLISRLPKHAQRSERCPVKVKATTATPPTTPMGIPTTTTPPTPSSKVGNTPTTLTAAIGTRTSVRTTTTANPCGSIGGQNRVVLVVETTPRTKSNNNNTSVYTVVIDQYSQQHAHL